jgi:hypothetical protein
MKIRRIDRHDVLRHAKNFEKCSLRATTIDMTNFPEFSIMNKSERASFDLRIIKERVLCRK